MTQDYDRLESLERYAIQLEIHPKEGESELEYRARVANAVAEEYGDALLAAEIIFGKDYNTFDRKEQLASLQIHLMLSKAKEMKLKQAGDTYYNMPWQYYEEVLKDKGFRKVYSYNFKDTHDTDRTEQYAIWLEDKKALLLTAESYYGMSRVGSTKLYYELMLPKPFEDLGEFEYLLLRQLLEKCSYKASAGRGPVFVAKDAKEWLAGHLDKLESYGFETNNPWREFDKHFLFLCDYSETTVDGYNYKEINRKKINALPEEVRTILGAGQ